MTKEMELFEGKRMTVKEVADILGVTSEAIKKHVRNLFPHKIKNGKTTYLNEYQVTEIKRHMIPTTQVVGAKTLLEENEIISNAVMILSRRKIELESKVKQLQLENKVMKPKAELADRALRDESKQYSITDAGKHLKIRQSKIFEILRNKGMLTTKNLPTQRALDLKILQLRTNNIDGKNYPQAIMTMVNIDNFRKMYR